MGAWKYLHGFKKSTFTSGILVVPGYDEDSNKCLVYTFLHGECAAQFSCLLDCVTLAMLINFYEPLFFIYKLGIITVFNSWS